MTQRRTISKCDEPGRGGKLTPVRMGRRGVLGMIAAGALAGCLGEAGSGETASPTPTPGNPTSAGTPRSTQTATPEPELDPADIDPGAVSSIAELAALSGEDDIEVEMEPGVYQMGDYINDARIEQMWANENWQYITFDGNGSRYDLTGVTIEIDTALREKVNAPVHHGNVFVISGDNNTFNGLEIVNKGDLISRARGGLHISVRGDGNRIHDFRLKVKGSWPYGYGDILGKGRNRVLDSPLSKRGGLQIVGNNTTVTDTTITMRALGHAFFFQGGATNTVLENCTAEGEMRSTTEMLQETEGPAYEYDFESHWPTNNDDGTIPPGYMKCLAEDAFRTYGAEKVTCKNCTARNMRGGFALGSKGGHRVENCRSIGCERGMYISAATTITGHRADAKFGPAMIFAGDNISAEIALTDETSEYTVPGTALLQGADTNLRLTVHEEAQGDWDALPPIRLGSARAAANNMYSFSGGHSQARNYELINETEITVDVSPKVTNSEVITGGPVTGDGVAENAVHDDIEDFTGL